MRCSMDDEVLLTGNFQKYPECKQTFSVHLGRKNLICQEKQDTTTYTKLSKGLTSVILKDIVSAKLFESKISNDFASYFQIIAYPMVHTGKKNPSKRKKVLLTFRVEVSDDKEENAMVAETWARTLEWLIVKPDLSLEELQDLSSFPNKKRILVLVNPKSGNGSSLSKFRKFAEPLFIDAGLFFQESVTKSANHGMEIAYALNTDDWDGIALCSGDGLAYEVIQGFMQRDDWENAIKMPIGMIPTGSGNALCASVLHAANDVFDITSAVFHIARGTACPIDLCSIQSNNHRSFAFLSLTWGIISDIDIESERFRLLGNARFTVGAVYRILALRLYGGKISYVPWDSEVTDYQENNCECSPGTENESDSLRANLDFNESSDKCQNANDIEKELVADGFQTETEKEEAPRTFAEAKKAVGVSTGKSRHFSITSGIFKRKSSKKYDIIDESYERSSFEDDGLKPPLEGNLTKGSNARGRRAFSTTEFEINNHSKSATKGNVKYSERPVQGPVDTMLPDVKEALSESWVTCEGEFVTVIIMLISHLGSNLLTCPNLKLGDGNMELLFAKKGISRKALIDVLTKMETGEHVGIKDLKIKKIKAFRLEPDIEKEGYLAVDGEVIDYTTVQGQVHKGMGRVFLCS